MEHDKYSEAGQQLTELNTKASKLDERLQGFNRHMMLIQSEISDMRGQLKAIKNELLIVDKERADKANGDH